MWYCKNSNGCLTVSLVYVCDFHNKITPRSSPQRGFFFLPFPKSKRHFSFSTMHERPYLQVKLTRYNKREKKMSDTLLWWMPRGPWMWVLCATSLTWASFSTYKNDTQRWPCPNLSASTFDLSGQRLVHFSGNWPETNLKEVNTNEWHILTLPQAHTTSELIELLETTNDPFLHIEAGCFNREGWVYHHMYLSGSLGQHDHSCMQLLQFFYRDHKTMT